MKRLLIVSLLLGSVTVGAEDLKVEVRRSALLPVETKAEKAARMAWWTDARFGMFIHFGLYAMPARHEWTKYIERISDEDYTKRYFTRFNPDLFDARAWVRAAKAAGMKYMVLTTKHHEGFCLWDSKHTDYKITKTPFGRDLVREFADACHAEGMRLGFYYSLLDWHHPHCLVDRHNPMRPKEEYTMSVEECAAALAKLNVGRNMDIYRQYMKDQITELLTNYGKVDLLFYDFTYEHPNYLVGKDWDSEGLLALTRKLQPGIIVNDRLGLRNVEGGWDIDTPEQISVPKCPTFNGEDMCWEVCQTFSGSWGYARDEETWKDPRQLVTMLVDCVSKKGNLLLNVGPTARGEFDLRAMERLTAMGRWTRANGRAIYGCTAAPEGFAAPEGTKLTYNPRTNRLYVHILDYPVKVLPIAFADRVDYAQFLHDGSELKIELPRTVSNEVRKDMPASLHLPVRRPAVEVPVVEMFLK